ncbi:hypothetical protein TCDM_11536 [Trypanosoma cruzi Dm28c]|uniref:Uncharacterized protein n=1 Tax=Trypanosoma cruzi Dm28c TaxID=1416333 RepID=V5B951_TRYCR|nr:hypothetical protein TCDM_11536 [Trypanosoma cruzi Dm28c]
MAGRRCVRASPPAVLHASHPAGKDRQTEREKEMGGCRQEALTISLAREHAAAPRRNTGGEDDKGEKQEAAQQTKETNDKRKSTARALTLAGDSTHSRTIAVPSVRR